MGAFSYWHWVIFMTILVLVVVALALMGLQKRVLLRHQQSGLTKNGYLGWSWTYLLFGWLVPVFRGEIGVGILHMILTFCTFGIFQWIMAWLYNRQYMTRQLLDGWQLDPNDVNYEWAKTKLGISDH